jgi:assimilatory nitrate reductase catalytic subunit
MTRFRNIGNRALSIPLPKNYETMDPFQWGGASPFAVGKFSHPNGRARLIRVDPLPERRDPAFPLTLNTGRYRDQWHTMTRTGLSPRLSQHRREPLLEVNPDDAKALGLCNAALATVTSPTGESIFRIHITTDQRPGDIYVPMHWTDAMSSVGRANRAVIGRTDPVSGQPGFKNSLVRVQSVATDWCGFLVTRHKPASVPSLLWTCAHVPGGWLIELAGQGAIDTGSLLPKGDQIEAFDAARGTRRIAVRGKDGALDAALFITRSGQLPGRDWISSQLGVDAAVAPELLAGRPMTPQADRGPIVCVCFDVGAQTILNAIANQTLMSVEAVGCALSAGTNCGSCRPAIKALLETRRVGVQT